MRRIITVLFLSGLSVIVCAQDITGNWMREVHKSDEGMEFIIRETMSLLPADALKAAVEFELNIPFDDPPSTLRFRLICNGAWTCSDGVLIKDIDTKTLKTEVLELPEGLPDMFGSLLTKTIAGKLKKEMKKGARESSRHRVVSITGDTLQIESVGTEESGTIIYKRQ